MAGTLELLTVDAADLYYRDDPLYEIWLSNVLDRIAQKRRADEARSRKGKK